MRAFHLAFVILVLTSLLTAGCAPTAPPSTATPPAATPAPLPSRTPSLAPSPTSAVVEGEFVLPAPVAASFQIGQVRVTRREYALGLSAEDLNNPDTFSPVYSALDITRWEPLRASVPEPSNDTTTQTLNDWGYRCEGSDLYRDGQLFVQAQLCDERRASINRSGTDFVWFLPVQSVAEGWLVRRDSVDQEWDQQWHFWVLPQYVGDDLLIVTDIFGDKGHELWVEINGQAAYSQSLHGMGDCLGAGLQALDDQHWGLNTEGDVIVDGERIGRLQGYQEAFGLRVLNGKPVYFAQQGSEIKLIYDGQVLPFAYDEVEHSCHPVYQEVWVHPTIGVLSPVLWFFARKAEAWYYVELEVQK